MLETLFAFSGRLKRLPFLGLTVLLVVLTVMGIAALIFVGASLLSGKGQISTGISAIVALLLGVIPLMWANLAIAAKRLRDAGFPPGLVMVAMMVFGIIDQFMLGQTLRIPGSHGLHYGSAIGLSVQIIYAGVLFLWPSAGSGGDEGGSSLRDISLPPTPAPEPVYVAPLAVAQVAVSPSREFGLRRR